MDKEKRIYVDAEYGFTAGYGPSYRGKVDVTDFVHGWKKFTQDHPSLFPSELRPRSDKDPKELTANAALKK